MNDSIYLVPSAAKQLVAELDRARDSSRLPSLGTIADSVVPNM